VKVVPSLADRWSSGAVARWATVAATLAILLPALAWSFPSLVVALVIIGLAFGIAEITANVQAAAVERAYARPLMSGLHASWSIGLLTGGLASAIATEVGASLEQQLAALGTGLAFVAAVGARGMLTPKAESDTRPQPTWSGDAARPAFLGMPALILTGLIAFCAFVAEGSVSDWSGVYLRGTQGASLATAALGVSVYSVGLTLGRLLGNRLVGRYGNLATLWRAALLAAAGLAIALCARSPGLALAGYGVLGFGVAPIVPIAFSVTGGMTSVPAAWAMSRVTMLAYAGQFLGPVPVGLLAHSTSLAFGLMVPTILLVLTVPLTSRLRTSLTATS
jgi:fucose permease